MKKKTSTKSLSKQNTRPTRQARLPARRSDQAPATTAGTVKAQNRAQGVGPITLLLVDDHEMVRQGVRLLLLKASRIAVTGEAGTMAEAVKEAARLRPTVVLMDLRLPDGSGVEACREIRSRAPRTRVIFLSSVEDDEAVLASIAAGADGYLLKTIGGAALVQAVETVAAGQSILDPSVTQRVLARMRTGARPSGGGMTEELSPQERRVLELVTEGKTNKEIASALDLSPKTVRNYLSNVFQKLQVTRRSQAAVLYSKRYSA